MAPHKPRDPQTFDSAVLRILGVLGPDRVAEVVGKSQALVYKWADPDCDQKPNIEQVHKLDEAMQAATAETPITSLLMRKLNTSPLGHAGKTLPERMCEIVSELGDLTNAQRLALDPSGPGGRSVTPREYAEISGEIAEVIEALNRYQRDLDAAYGVRAAE